MLKEIVSQSVRICLIFSVMFLSACMIAEKQWKSAKNWVDQEETALVESWGPPAQVYQSGDRKFLVYFSKRNVCRTTFEIMDGKVINWNLKGSDCKEN